MNERLTALIDGVLDGRLSPGEWTELAEMLRGSETARKMYWEMVGQDAQLQELVREAAGRDLARMAANELSIGRVSMAPADDGELRADSSSYWPHRRSLAARGVLAVAICVVIGFVIWPSALSRGERLATLHSLSGDVWLVNRQQALVKAASGQPFFAGEALRVGPEGVAELTLADGSLVALGGDSVFRFVAAEGAARPRMHLECGAADIEATPQPPDRPLVVTTEQARLTVLGTRFRLYASASGSRIELEEGKVQFERQSDGQTVEVAAGQCAVAEAGPTKPLVAEVLSSAWRLRQALHRAGDRVAFSHDGAKLATADSGRVKLWNAATGEPQQMVDKVGRFDGLAFAPSNESLIALGESGRVLYWALDAKSPKFAELKPETGRLRRCAISHDGRWLAQTSDIDAGYLPIWEVDDAGAISLVRSIPMKMSGVAITATSQGPRVVAGNWNGTTVVWDAITGSELARYQFRSQLHVLALSGDGRQLCGYGNASGLVILDTESGEQRVLWPSGSVAVTCLRFSRDGRELIAAMADGLVRGWLTENGEATFVLPTGDARVLSLAVADDGRSLATVGDKGSVRLWQRED